MKFFGRRIIFRIFWPTQRKRKWFPAVVYGYVGKPIRVGQSWRTEAGLMSPEEFDSLFTRADMHRVCLSPLINCMGEMRRMVEMAILEDRQKRATNETEVS